MGIVGETDERSTFNPPLLSGFGASLLREDAMKDGKGSAFAKASARLAAVGRSGPIYVSAKRTHRFSMAFLM